MSRARDALVLAAQCLFIFIVVFGVLMLASLDNIR